MNHTGSQSSQRHHFVLVQDPRLILHFSFQFSNFPQVPEKTHQTIDFLRVKKSGCRHLYGNLAAVFSQQGGFIKQKLMFTAVAFIFELNIEIRVVGSRKKIVECHPL